MPARARAPTCPLTQGNQGISDQVLRYGGTIGAMDYRITAGRRSDSGFENFHDSRKTDYVAFRGDLRLNPRDELQLHLGASRNSNGIGFAGSPGDPLRTPQESGHHLHAIWKRALGPDEEFSISAYHMHDSAQEDYIVRAGPLYAPVDADRQTRRTHLELQHIFRLNPAARVVWGFEQRHESVASKFMFDTANRQSIRLSRLFGNLEWRLAPKWLLNAGAMLEKHSFAGSDLAPRLMLNYQPLPGQTLRLGATTAYRTPSLAEERADIKYYVCQCSGRGADLPCQRRPAAGTHPDGRTLLSGRVPVHRPDHRFALLQGKRHPHHRQDGQPGQLPQPLGCADTWPRAPVALEALAGHAGVAQPRRVRIDSEDQRNVDSAPRRSTMLLLSQKLPLDIQLSLIHYWISEYQWLGWSDYLPKHRRLDVRLGVPFRSGPMKGEFALVSQNVQDPYSEFRADYVFKRRTFATLSLEF